MLNNVLRSQLLISNEPSRKSCFNTVWPINNYNNRYAFTVWNSSDFNFFFFFSNYRFTPAEKRGALIITFLIARFIHCVISILFYAKRIKTNEYSVEICADGVDGNSYGAPHCSVFLGIIIIIIILFRSTSSTSLFVVKYTLKIAWGFFFFSIIKRKITLHTPAIFHR